MKTLRVVLWDQLSLKISSLRDINPQQDTVLICETIQECSYVKHHKKKLVFILSAMRHFAKELKDKGFKIIYVKLDDPLNTGTLKGEINRITNLEKFDNIVVTWPGEHRLLTILENIQSTISTPLIIKEDERFLITINEFKFWASKRRELVMEYFYREMRQKYEILMNGKDPEGGKWNFDNENRKVPKGKLSIPQPYISKPDDITQELIELVEHYFPDHFGDISPFHFAVTTEQAKQAFEKFITERLEFFGHYQDAMIEHEPWMYHSHISFYMNIGLLDPFECIKRVEKAYYDGFVSINSAEGFIRQILGWREYVRGVYWLKMPEYKEMNFLEASRPLPEFFWTGDTKMNCLKQCITETKENAYAHHIQRLMVLGNFALIAGIDPRAVNEWYLIVYADAFEWVELPNVTGMILFADGGYLGSKPYAASGAYINKMSNYCQKCQYTVNEKNGQKACPFNYLYWDFLLRHQEKLKTNHRLTMIYAVLNKKDSAAIAIIRDDAKKFFQELGLEHGKE
jgi:deoxyribodipyrimidine photolyase-related protein